ncbi:O-antigen ligase family protein [Cryobacterium sp. AP23]
MTGTLQPGTVAGSAPPRPPAREASTRISYDPMVILQVYVVVLIGSPSIYVIGPLGAAGTPATILGVLFLMLWLVGLVTRQNRLLQATPVHWALAAVCVATVLAFVAGMLRPITAAEVSSAVRGLIMLASWAGVILLVADTMRSRARLDAFLRLLVLMGAFLAGLGIVQFIWGVNFIELLHLPGLVANEDGGSLYSRSGFPRVSATALHSIEFAAVLGIILPLSVYLAFTATRRRAWQWAQLGLIGVAIPLTVSRSGMLGLIIGVLFALCVATNRQRMWMLVILPVVAIAFRVVMPGLLGTIRELFLDAGQDQSIDGRVRDYEAVEAFFAQSPWVGRGPFTFLPSMYRTLDNQFLGILVEQGIIGLIAFVCLLVVAIMLCFMTGLRARDRQRRLQAFALAASLTSAAVLCATFDVFGFPMAMGALSLVLGAAAAAWRLRQKGMGRPNRPVRRPRVLRGWTTSALTAAMALGLGAGGYVISQATGGFEAQGSLLLGIPSATGQNSYDSKTDVPGMSDVVVFIMNSAPVAASLADDGVEDYTVATGQGSLERYTEVLGNSPLVWISTRASTPEAAADEALQVLREVKNQLAMLQRDRGIPSGVRVLATDDFITPDVFTRPVSRAPALGGLVLLVVLCALLCVGILRRVPAASREEPTHRAASRPHVRDRAMR